MLIDKSTSPKNLGAIRVAFVVTADPALTEDNVKTFALDNGPASRHPRNVHFLRALPLSAVNKVDTLALTALALEKSDEQ